MSRKELLEQSRLLGMSGEREARHLARIEELERVVARLDRELERLQQVIDAVVTPRDDWR